MVTPSFRRTFTGHPSPVCLAHHRHVRFHVDQTPRARQRRVVRRRLGHVQIQESPQAQRIRDPPRNPPLRRQTLEVASYGRQARAAGCWVVCLSAARRASFNASMSLHRALPAFRCAASRPAALIASMSVCQAGSGGAGGTGGGASGGASSRNAEVDPGRSDRAAQREAGGGGVGRVRRRRGGRPRFGVGEGGVDGLAAAVAAGCGAPDLHLATVQRRLDLRRRGQRHGRPWWSHRIRLVGCGMRRTLLGRRRLPSCYDWRAWRQAVSDRCTSTVWRVRSTSAAGRRPSARCHR